MGAYASLPRGPWRNNAGRLESTPLIGRVEPQAGQEFPDVITLVIQPGISHHGCHVLKSVST